MLSEKLNRININSFHLINLKIDGLRLRFHKKIKTHAILPIAKHTLETRESDRRFFQRTKCNYHVNSDQDSK